MLRLIYTFPKQQETQTGRNKKRDITCVFFLISKKNMVGVRNRIFPNLLEFECQFQNFISYYKYIEKIGSFQNIKCRRVVIEQICFKDFDFDAGHQDAVKVQRGLHLKFTR